jgi:5-methylcytosine-specific restriction endonuclease McrA
MSDKRNNSPASRRARKKGVFVEHIDKRKLWTDYQGICGLCLQPVKYARTTIDHILPLSQGGLHEYANVQPAHSLCNYVKGNGEFTLEALHDAIAAREKKRQARRSKGYRNKTGRKGAPLQPAFRAL